MKSFIFSHWKLEETGQGLLFFCQALEEMLFHYGHDSLKVPALNFHFLCVEIHNTIAKINNDVIDRGNIRPLFDELKDSFSHDPIAKQLFGNEFDSLFFFKTADGEINRSCSDLYKTLNSEVTIKKIGRVINYLLNEMERDNKYYSLIQAAITETIQAVPFSDDNQRALYQLSRILLTELINCSYSQEYIYWVVNDIFYNKKKPVTNIADSLHQFWQSFDFEQKEYKVVLPLQEPLKKYLRNFKNVSVRKNEVFPNDLCHEVIELKLDAMDQYDAQSRAIGLVGFFISLLQYNDHKRQSYTADRAVITLKDSNKVYKLQTPITPLKRGNSASDKKTNEKIAMMVSNFSFSPRKLVNVIDLHSSALNSVDIGNQLLNLWTIVEVIVPTESKNSFDKINQICNAITTILNAQYVSSLISQLLTDLKRCIPDVVTAQLANISKGESDEEKVAALLVLPDYQTEQDNITNALTYYPLLKYRIKHYSKMFSNRAKLKQFLTAHRKRLSWQIMRIYRNRNMIVHDGSHFPYIDIIVQNLHYYVDTIIDTINVYAGNGYNSINTIFTAIQQREYQYQLLLEKKNTDGNPQEVDSDFAPVVLGYLK